LLVPFISKPVHIDDAAYVAIAKHIAKDPADYYGLSLNWDGVARPVYEWHASPPFVKFYLAFIGTLFGWKEWVLHTAFLLPAILASAATFLLAKRLCKRPFVALAATLCTPAFIISGTSLMLDTWLLAYFMLAMALWVEGFARGSIRYLFCAAICAGLALWTKYFGIALIPLLTVYALLKSDRPKYWWVLLLVPTAMLIAEQAYSYFTYRHFLFTNVAHVVMDERISDRTVYTWLLIGLSFAGGCTFSVMQLGGVLWNGRLRLLGTLLWLAMSFLLVWLTSRDNVTLTAGFKLPTVSIFVYAVLLLGGSQLFSLTYSELRHRADPESWLLALWIAGTFFFACYVTWSVNVRSLLPLVPAVAMLAARRLDFIEVVNPKKTNRRIVTILSVSAIVSLLIARADMEWAQSQREAAYRYGDFAKSHDGTVYFQGHWGFQHYMHEAGVAQFDAKTTVLQPGDVVICPRNNANVQPIPRDYTAARAHDQFSIAHRMATMSIDLGAGFYSDLWGPLPFALGLKMPPDDYYTYFISKPGKPFQE